MKALILLLILVSLAVKAQTKVGAEQELDLYKRPNDSCAIGVIEQNNLASYWRCDDGFYKINAATFAESFNKVGGTEFQIINEAEWNQKLIGLVGSKKPDPKEDVILDPTIIQIKDGSCKIAEISIMYGITEYKLCGSKFYKKVKAGFQQIQRREFSQIASLAGTDESEPSIKSANKNDLDSERTLGKDLKSDDDEKSKTGSSQSGAEQE
jgi:hypothetical protein